MALDNLIEQTKERLTELKDQIQESQTYNNLKEKYDNLSPKAQTGLIVGFFTFISLVFASIPYSHFSNSGTYTQAFKEDRQLLREILRASVHAEDAPTQAPPPINQIISSIRGRLGNARLLDEQIIAVSAMDASTIGRSLVPEGINQEGILVELKQLNIRQVNEIGVMIKGVHPAVRMAGLEMKANSEDPEYYDVSFKLISYSLPASEASEGETGGSPRRGGRSG